VTVLELPRQPGRSSFRSPGAGSRVVGVER
jgi:hypothetical protein